MRREGQIRVLVEALELGENGGDYFFGYRNFGNLEVVVCRG